MMKAKGFGLVLMLMLVTACTPVVHKTTHYKHRAPVRHVNVQTTHTQVYRSHVEVTLYADNSYRGVYFQPIQLVIAAGQYVEIPVKNRRGQHTRIFAHYHEGDLHFDSSRRCKRIPGSKGFKYAKNWDNGHKYGHINAGKDYDLTGLRLKVRSVPADRYRVNRGEPGKVVEKSIKTVKTKEKRYVENVKPRHESKKVVVKETIRGKDLQLTKNHKKPAISKQVQVVSTKKNTIDNVVKTDKVTHRPHIVQKLKTAKNDRKTTGSVKVVKNDSKHNGGHQVVLEKRRVHHKEKTIVKTNHKSDSRDNIKKKVKVSFKGGTVMVNGKQGKLKNSSVTLKDGDSLSVSLVAKNGHKINVPVSYRNGTLSVTQLGRKFKRDSSWAKGQTYNLNTKGSARIENVQLTVVTL